MALTLEAPSKLLEAQVPVPRYVDARTFAATTAESWTVPAGVNFAIFSGTTGFYLRIGGTAAAPSDTSDGTASQYVPSSVQYIVEEGTVISIVPTAAGTVTIACYSR